MPVTVAKIASNVASVTITGGTLGEDTVTVEYYPGRVTEKLIAQMMAFGTMSEGNVSETQVLASFREFNEILAGKPQDADGVLAGRPPTGLLKSWDVYEDEAQQQMFPINAQRIEELPLPFRMQIVNGIVADMRPESSVPQA